MNQSQVSSTLDRAATVIATWFLTWLASKGYISQSDTVAFLPILIALPAAFVGWYKNRASSIVASAAALPDVKGVVTNNTMAGRDLAESVPDKTVVSAGTPEATAIAKPGAST